MPDMTLTLNEQQQAFLKTCLATSVDMWRDMIFDLEKRDLFWSEDHLNAMVNYTGAVFLYKEVGGEINEMSGYSMCS